MLRRVVPRRRYRVLLLRPARLVPERSARRAVAVGPRPVRRRGRAGPPGAAPGPQQLRAVRAVVGRAPRHGVRGAPPAAPQGPRDLEHDVERTALQRLRDRRPDAGDGSGRPGRDQAVRGRGHDRRSAIRAAADGASLRVARVPDAVRGLARPGQARHRPHQLQDLRADAGAERTRSQWHPRGLGPFERPAGHRRADARHRRDPRHDGPGAYALDVGALPQGRFLLCPNGSHLSQFDDPEHYFPGLLDFLRSL